MSWVAVWAYHWDRHEWEFWHYAPTRSSAEQVARALNAMFPARTRFYVYGGETSAVASWSEVYAHTRDGRRISWGFSVNAFNASIVRDSLARLLSRREVDSVVSANEHGRLEFRTPTGVA